MPLRVVAGTAAVAMACLSALGVSSSAQQILRSGVNLVVVDMRVLSKNKQVADLGPDEVTLLVDGRPRPIVSFVYYPARGKGRRMPTEAGTALPLTNSIPRVVLLIDRDSLPPNDRQPVHASAQEFVDRLPDGFLIAAAPLPLSRSIRFERDRGLVRKAVAEAFAGGFQRSLEMGETARFWMHGGEGELRNRPFCSLRA